MRVDIGESEIKLALQDHGSPNEGFLFTTWIIDYRSVHL